MAVHTLLSPATANFYRLRGPHPWYGAREAILTIEDRIVKVIAITILILEPVQVSDDTIEYYFPGDKLGEDVRNLLCPSCIRQRATHFLRNRRLLSLPCFLALTSIMISVRKIV